MKNLKEFREFVNESDGFGTSPFLLKKWNPYKEKGSYAKNELYKGF